MEKELARTAELAAGMPDKILIRGSGWGVLEQMRRTISREEVFNPASVVFDNESLGPDQQPWKSLLETGIFPYRSPADEPGAYMVAPEWRSLLENALQQPANAHWLTWLHLGVMYYYQKQFDMAESAWTNSIRLEPSAWSYRNLAILAGDRGKKAECADHYLKAFALCSNLKQLVVECCQALIHADMFDELESVLGKLEPSVFEHGRIKAARVQLAVYRGDFKTAKQILSGKIEIPDIREGEVSLSELWYDLHEKMLVRSGTQLSKSEIRRKVEQDFPVPFHIDFRIAAE